MFNYKSKQAKISDLIEIPIQTGFQVRGKVEHDPNGNYSIIQVKDINRSTHQVNLGNCEKIFIEEDKHKFMDKYLIQKEDVLYLSKLRPGPFRYHGKLEMIIPMAHFYLLRPKDNQITGDYLCWALHQNFIKPYIKRSLKGTTLPFISKSDLMDFVIPVPNIETQKMITEISNLRVKENELVAELEEKKELLINELLLKHL